MSRNQMNDKECLFVAVFPADIHLSKQGECMCMSNYLHVMKFHEFKTELCIYHRFKPSHCNTWCSIYDFHEPKITLAFSSIRWYQCSNIIPPRDEIITNTNMVFRRVLFGDLFSKCTRVCCFTMAPSHDRTETRLSHLSNLMLTKLI